MNDGWECRFDATELQAREHTIMVRDWLAACDVDEGSRGAIELVLAEVLNNVVEHAFPGEETGEIRLNGRWDGNRVDISVCDGGAPYPGLKLPEGQAADLDVEMEDLPEGGFGWNLIRQLTSSLIYRRQTEQNHLDLHFNIPVMPG